MALRSFLCYVIHAFFTNILIDICFFYSQTPIWKLFTRTSLVGYSLCRPTPTPVVQDVQYRDWLMEWSLRFKSCLIPEWPKPSILLRSLIYSSSYFSSYFSFYFYLFSFSSTSLFEMSEKNSFYFNRRLLKSNFTLQNNRFGLPF